MRKHICYQCVNEAFLSRQVRYRGRRKECSYCGESRACYELETVASLVDGVMQEYFVRTPDEPGPFERAMARDVGWNRDGDLVEVVIMNVAAIPEAAATDIQQILATANFDYESAKMGEESEYQNGSHYQERDRNHTSLDDEWDELETALKSEARFFNSSFAAHLASVFDSIDELTTFEGRPLVMTVGPGTELTTLYRARVFQSDESLQDALARPDQRMGPPPSAKATAGRMNAHGISVFYGAVDPRVALAEVRPPVGSQVAIAQFELLRPLRLLDLTSVRKVVARGSYFDEQYTNQLDRALFLRSLSARITRPVMPDDEPIEYLATQAVSDFLATESKIRLDGIIFPSAQSAHGPNVVLFHKSSRVEPLAIPVGTEIDVRLGQMYEEGWEQEYSVWEEVPAGSVPSNAAQPQAPHFNIPATSTDARPMALRIMPDGSEVHVVEMADYKATPHKVRRQRIEMRASNPWKPETLDFDP